MSKERLDIAIGILDPTENAIERIKNQHKFEKDLSEFLNTNEYSKDKYWVAGMLNQVSEYCKEKIDTLMENQQRIAELEEQLKNAIVPKFKFMEKVYHINKDYFYKKDWFVEELLINGFEYKIDKRKNSLVMWYSTYFDDYKNYKYQGKDLFATKEEAQAKLEELGGENK